MQYPSVGDFCLKHKLIGKTQVLPLYQISSITTDHYDLNGRYGDQSRCAKGNITLLDTAYESIVWDELIQLESRILFLTECLQDSDQYGSLLGYGIIRVIDNSGVITTQEKPWERIKCDLTNIHELSSSRFAQIEGQLVKLEEEHEFLSDAIDYLVRL